MALRSSCAKVSLRQALNKEAARRGLIVENYMGAKGHYYRNCVDDHNLHKTAQWTAYWNWARGFTAALGLDQRPLGQIPELASRCAVANATQVDELATGQGNDDGRLFPMAGVD